MIAIVYPQFHEVGGIARYLDSFMAQLAPDGPGVSLLTSPGARPESGRPRLIHIPCPRSRYGLLLWSLRTRRRLLDMHRQGLITCINQHIPPLIPGLLLPRSIPMVLTAHTTYVGMSGRFEGNRHFSSPWNALSVWLKTRLERQLIARAQTVISLTEQGRSELAHYGRSEGIVVIPNGVDVEAFQGPERSHPDIDVLFSGRIERRKGSRPMVELCRRLIDAKPDIRIAIVGYGDDEAYVRDALAGFGDRVWLTGKIAFGDMLAFYRRSRVYVSTSYYEGLPGTCLEAMATGLPAVAWDLMFYRGLVTDGVTGLLAPPNDHGRMAAQVLALLSDPERATAMGRRAQWRVREQYDWKQLSRQVMQVLEQAAAARSPAKEAA